MKHLYLLVLSLLIMPILNVVLIPVQITPTSRAINTVTTYSFFINRRFAYNGGFPTFISSPANITGSSNIIITYPVQYTNMTGQTCTSSSVTFATSSSSSTCSSPSCNFSGQNLIIAGCVPSTSISADNITIVIYNVYNPSPAVTTGSFVVTLGADSTTASSASGITPNVQLNPGSITNCVVTFNPTTVNTASNMSVSITPNNTIPSTNSSITITFPSTWQSDVTTTPINVSTPSCINPVGIGTLACSWTSSTMLTINIASSTNISSIFSFTITNIRSPSTPQPTNTVVVTTLTNGNQLDIGTTSVTGLTPKTMLAYSSSTTNPVNTQFTLFFGFIAADSFNLSGITLQIAFPAGSIFSTNPSIQTSGLTVSSSSRTGLTITIVLSGSSIVSLGSSFIIGVSTYTAPSTTTPTSPFTITMLKNTYPIMTGNFQFTAVSGQITATMVPTNYVINQATTYSFSVTLNDVISTAGCLVITFPSNISLSLSSCSAMGTNVNSTPNCTSSGSNTIFTVCNLFTSTFTVPNTVNITLNNGINPGSTQQTSNFSISSYYNSTGLVATGSILGFKPLPGTLNSNYVSISPSSNIVMASSVSYSIKFNNLNKISTNGILTIVFPTDITTGSLTSLNCQRSFNAGSFSATSCSGTSNSSGIYFTFSSIFTSQIVANTSIAVSISNVFTNPVSTQIVNSFTITTTDSSGNIIDTGTGYKTTYIGANLVTSITQSNTTNSAITNFTFTFSQPSVFGTNSQVLITFPPSIIPQSGIVCIDQTYYLINCSLSNSIVTATLNSNASNSNFKIIITNIKNAPSLAPSSPFIIQTRTSTGSFYAQNSITTVANLLASVFTITSSFTPQSLGSATSLTISMIPTNSTINNIIINLASTFSIVGLTCSGLSFTGTCANTSTTGSLSITGTFVSTAMSLTISGFISPTSLPNDYTTVSSYDANNFLIDQNLQSIKYTTNCTYPCNTCSGTKTNCTSCYTTLSNVTQLYYLNNTCLTSCPIGYFGNSPNYLCTVCNSICKGCQINSTNCNDCYSNSTFKYLSKSTATAGTCVSACDPTFYPNNNTYPVTCTKCGPSCLTCTTATFCLTCQSNLFFYNNTCVSTCPTLISIANPSTATCDLCTPPCATCQTTITTCLTCTSNFFINGTTCVQCSAPMIVYNNNCVNCSATCATCSKIPSNCTSCTSKFLFNNTCIDNCTSGYLGINNVCYQCNSNCRTCNGSVNNCSSCNSGYLVPSLGTCVTTCPSNLYLNPSDSTCIPCIQPCFSCSETASTCTSCKLGYFLLGNQCVQTCPDGTTSNGTHCISNSGGGGGGDGGGGNGGGSGQVNNTLNAKIFPLPFSIAGTIVIITAGVSKFQNSHTFFSGAVFSLFGLLQWGAYITFLILYYVSLELDKVFIAIIGVLAILYIINIISFFVYVCILKKDKKFNEWYNRKCNARTLTALGYIVCGLITFKFMNIIFCRLFSFYVFRAKLENTNRFFGFNFVIFCSAPHTLGSIGVAAYTAYQYSGTVSQLYLQAIDLIIVSIFTCIFGIANSHKEQSFFDQVSEEETLGKLGNDNEQVSGIGEPLYGNQQRQKGGRLQKYMSFIDSQHSQAQLRPDETSSNQISFQNDLIDQSTQSYLKNKYPHKNIVRAQNTISEEQQPEHMITQQNDRSHESFNSNDTKIKIMKSNNQDHNEQFLQGQRNITTQNNELGQNSVLRQQQILQNDSRHLNTEQYDGAIYPLDDPQTIKKLKEIQEQENNIFNNNSSSSKNKQVNNQHNLIKTQQQQLHLSQSKQSNKTDKQNANKNNKFNENQQYDDNREDQNGIKQINFTLGQANEIVQISDIDNKQKQLNDQSGMSQFQYRMEKGDSVANTKTKNGQDTSNQYLTDNPMKQFLGSDQQSQFKFGTKSHKEGRQRIKNTPDNDGEIIQDDEDQNKRNIQSEQIDQIDDSIPDDPLSIQNHPYHVVKKNKRIPTDPPFNIIQTGLNNIHRQKPHDNSEQLPSNLNSINNKNDLPQDESDQHLDNLKSKYNKGDGQQGHTGINRSPANDPLKLLHKHKKPINQLLMSSSEYTQQQEDNSQTLQHQIIPNQLNLTQFTKQEQERRKPQKQPKKFKVVYDTSGMMDEDSIDMGQIGVSPSDFNHYNQRFVEEQLSVHSPHVPFAKNDVPKKPQVIMSKSKDNIQEKKYHSYERMPTINKQQHLRKDSGGNQQPQIGQVIMRPMRLMKPTSAIDRNKRQFSYNTGLKSKNLVATHRQGGQRQKTLQPSADMNSQLSRQKIPRNNKQLQKIYLQRLSGPYRSREGLSKSKDKLF